MLEVKHDEEVIIFCSINLCMFYVLYCARKFYEYLLAFQVLVGSYTIFVKYE
jgi:hypothetical protein